MFTLLKGHSGEQAEKRQSECQSETIMRLALDILKNQREENRICFSRIPATLRVTFPDVLRLLPSENESVRVHPCGNIYSCRSCFSVSGPAH